MYSSIFSLLLATVGANAAQTYDGGGYPGDPGISYGESTDYGHLGCWRTFWGPEPQTCYAPRYGCYPGNNRFMHRYPAFHGYHYRRPYNYRNVFDYPWHAALHEPTSHFSYNVIDDAPGAGAPLAPPLPAEEIHAPVVDEAPTAAHGRPPRNLSQLSREEIVRRRELRQAAKPSQLRTGPDQKKISAAPVQPSQLKIRNVQHMAAPLPAAGK